MDFPSTFRNFAVNHPYLARTAALPVALGLGFKASLEMPYNGLIEIVKSVASLAIPSHDPRISKFTIALVSGLLVAKGITMIAVSPLFSPIMGAAKATSVFFRCLRNPAAF
jgi:hypothetical protein